jgi:hypothetical protein
MNSSTVSSNNLSSINANSQNPTINLTNIFTSQAQNRAKKWELLNGVKKGLQEILIESNNHPEVKFLIDSTDKLKETKEKINKQSEELKLGLLISSRERNVYLEKLRKIEEYCEERNWEDSDGLMKEIYEILYGDN